MKYLIIAIALLFLAYWIFMTNNKSKKKKTSDFEPDFCSIKFSGTKNCDCQ